MLNSKIFYITILLCFGTISFLYGQVHDRSKITTRVEAKVTESDSLFSYKYKVINVESSELQLNYIRFEVGDLDKSQGGTIINYLFPENRKWNGWATKETGEPISPKAMGSVVWIAKYDTLTSTKDLFIPPNSVINKGDSVMLGFESDGLPNIMRYWTRGYVKPYKESEFDSLLAAGFTEDELSPLV